MATSILMRINELESEGWNTIMLITVTELKNNFEEYIQLAAMEDILITRNGNVVARLSNPNQDRVAIAKSLFGIIQADETLTKQEYMSDRAIRAMRSLSEAAQQNGTANMSLDEINAEIAESRVDRASINTRSGA